MMGIYKVNVSAYIEPIETFSLSERNKEMIWTFLITAFMKDWEKQDSQEHYIIKKY
jgi:hypothetical protein